MSAQHTPGPWQAKPTGPWDGWDGWSVEDDAGRVVCDAHGSQFDGAREANARLIAAAPDLLSALQDIYEMCEGYVPNTSKASWNAARIAIAKATGSAS